MLTWFQTASGSWHWPSIFFFISWLVAGFFAGVNIYLNHGERLEAAEKQKASDAEIAKTKASLLEARKAADSANERATKIERGLTPRALTKEQMGEIRTFLTPKTKGRINVHHAIPDTEAAEFARQIKEVLTSSGYEVNGKGHLGNLPLDGLWLQVGGDGADAPNYVGNIQAAFESVGFPVQAQLLGSGPPEIDFFVGKKPTPDQVE